MSAIRMLREYLRPHWRWAVLAPLVMALEVAMDLMQPRMVQRIVDQGIAHHDLHTVIHAGAWMLGFAIVGLLGGVGCTVFSVLAGQGLGADLRRDLFRKTQTLSFGNLDRLETGGLITRLTNDVQQVQDTTMMLLRIMVRAPLLLVGSLAMGMLTSPRLAVLFAPLVPVVLVLVVVVVRRTYPMFGEVQSRLDRLNTILQENLAGVRVVKAFVRGDHEIARFGEANERLVQQNIAAIRVSAVTMPGMMLIVNVGIIATLWVGGGAVARGSLQVGQVIAFINYLMQTLMSLMMVSMLVLRMARAEASAQRIREVLDETPDIRGPEPGRTDLPGRGRVEFDRVTFGYGADDGEPVLQEVSFTAEPGQAVAILGATGSGKSTMVALIPRFYDVTGGRVLLDGVDVREIAEPALRASVAIALQEPILFTGTVRENIAYGRDGASDAEVEQVARAARAHGFIEGFPQGYDTVIGQRGVNLSGGQKQRIAIARALLAGPDVLVLDDSTSAVDVETEAHIQAEIAGMRAGRTSIVVAQRISTVLSADCIVVLDAGRVVAQGRHDDLLATSAVYRDIYESQLGGGEVDADAS